MSSIRAQALAAMTAALNGAGKPAGVTIHRQRAVPIDHDQQLPAIVLYTVEEVTEAVPQSGAPLVARSCTVRAECRIACGMSDVPDDVLDPLVSWAVTALVAAQQLGGLVNFVTEQRTTWDAVALDRVYAAAAVDFQVTYDTAAADPASRN